MTRKTWPDGALMCDLFTTQSSTLSQDRRYTQVLRNFGNVGGVTPAEPADATTYNKLSAQRSSRQGAQPTDADAGADVAPDARVGEGSPASCPDR